MKRTMSWLLVSLAALLAFPALASAQDPFTVTLDEARLQLNNGDGADVRENQTGAQAEQESKLTGTINGTAVNIPQSGVSIARFTTSQGAPVVTTATSAFTGTYDNATGAAAVSGTANVAVILGVNAQNSQPRGCLFPGLQLNLATDNSTANGELNGVKFLDGLDGDGGMVASWPDLPTMVEFNGGDNGLQQCELLESLADGPGGVKLADDVSLDPFIVSWADNRLQLNNGSLFDDVAEDSTTFDGYLDTDDGAIDVPADEVDLAQFTSSSGAPVVSSAEENYTGGYDADTGDLDIGGETTVRIVTGASSACQFSDFDLQFSTDNDAPSGDFTGVPFSGGLNGASGAAVATFTELPPVTTIGAEPPGASCQAVRTLNNGPGAATIGNEIGPEVVVPPVDDPTISVVATPENASVRQGGGKTFTAEVTSQDALEELDATVCAKVAGGSRSPQIVGQRCKDAGDVYTEAGSVRFRVKSKRNTTPKNFTVTFTASADGVDDATDTSRLKVTKKPRRGRR